MDITIHSSFLPHEDPEESLAFYRDALGFEVRLDVGRGQMRWITVGPPNQPDTSIVLCPPAANPGITDDERRTIAKVTTSPTEAQRLSDLAILRRVRDRMDREYAQPLDVEALARGAYMSAGHLSRQFKAAYGESPYSYLMTRRIERAMALLRRGELCVTEVCFEVGCSSLGTFSTRFTELVGVPPSVYRTEAAGATDGIPPCVAKQVTRRIRNRDAVASARN